MVAAIRSEFGASRKLLVGALEEQFVLLVSTPLLLEYEAVMTRREHIDAAGISAADVVALLDAIAIVARPVRLAFLWRPAVRDANDDMVLETAANGQAEGIVTFNRRDFGGVTDRFGIPVLLPGEALSRLEIEK